MNIPRPRYLLRSGHVQRILDRNHLSHRRFADHLGISRSYWSQLFNRHRALTPDLRRDLLTSRYLRDLPEEELWEVVPPDEPSGGAPCP